MGTGSSKLGGGGGNAKDSRNAPIDLTKVQNQQPGANSMESIIGTMGQNKGLSVQQQLSKMNVAGISDVASMISANTKAGDSITMPNGTFTKQANGQWISNKGFTFSANEVANIMLRGNAIGNSIKFKRK